MGLGIPQNSFISSSFISFILKIAVCCKLDSLFSTKNFSFSLYQFYSEICCMLQAGKVFGSLASLWTGEHWRKSLAVVNSEMRETCSLWNEKRGRNGVENVTAGMRDKLNIDCHPLFGGLGYLMLKNFAAYFIKTSILNKNSIRFY